MVSPVMIFVIDVVVNEENHAAAAAAVFLIEIEINQGAVVLAVVL